ALQTRTAIPSHSKLDRRRAIDSALHQVRMRRVHTPQRKSQRRIAPFFFPNPFSFPRIPPRRGRRRRAHPKPLLQPQRRLADRTPLHRRHEVQHVAALLTRETLKHILAQTHAKRIAALAPVNRTATL